MHINIVTNFTTDIILASCVTGLISRLTPWFVKAKFRLMQAFQWFSRGDMLVPRAVCYEPVMMTSGAKKTFPKRHFWSIFEPYHLKMKLKSLMYNTTLPCKSS